MRSFYRDRLGTNIGEISFEKPLIVCFSFFLGKPLADDPKKQGLKFGKGVLSFAGAGKDSRTTHMFFADAPSGGCGETLSFVTFRFVFFLKTRRIVCQDRLWTNVFSDKRRFFRRFATGLCSSRASDWQDHLRY